MTLYNLLVTESKEYPSKLSQRAIEQLGMQISEAYKVLNLGTPCEKIQVSEPHGTFMVNDYPNWFIAQMKLLIFDFYKRITEKPVDQKPTKNHSNGPSTKRKRIPIQQPAYSTRKK